MTVPKGGPGTVTFDDPYGSGSWTKGYDGTDPTGSGATFDVVRTKKWTYDITPGNGIDPPVLVDIPNDSGFVVTDNVTNDAAKKADTDNDMGDISVAGLKSGRWCVTEPAGGAPSGWFRDTDTECFTVGPTTGEAAGAAGGSPTFNDELKKVDLRVDKTESSPASRTRARPSTASPSSCTPTPTAPPVPSSTPRSPGPTGTQLSSGSTGRSPTGSRKWPRTVTASA